MMNGGISLLDAGLAADAAGVIRVRRPYGLKGTAADIFPLYSSEKLLSRAFAIFLDGIGEPVGAIFALSHWSLPLAVLLARHSIRRYGGDVIPQVFSFAHRVARFPQQIAADRRGVLVDDVVNVGDTIETFIKNDLESLAGSNLRIRDFLVVLDNDQFEERPGIEYAKGHGVVPVAVTKVTLVLGEGHAPSSLSRTSDGASGGRELGR